MADPDLKCIIQSLPFACALHRFVIDEQGIPCDYIFIEVNLLFEEYTGLTASNIIGKRVTEVIPGIKNEAFNWIETYARVTYSGEKMEFQQYSEALQKWYSVNAYSPAEHYFIAIIEDITEKKALAQQAFSSEKTIQRQEIILDIYSKQFPDQQSFLDYALHRALELTESQYGYIYFYNEDLQQFELNTWTIGVLSDCEVIDKKTVYQLEKTGFWGEVVRQRKPIINNNFMSHHPQKKGFPEGHVSLTRFMSVPVIIDDKIVAVAGLANKESDYTSFDVNQLSLLMQSVWLINTQRYLKTSLAQYKQKTTDILDHVPILLSEFHEDTTLTFVNDAYCKYFHLHAEDLVGRKFLDFIPPEEHDSILERIHRFTPENPRALYTHRVVINEQIHWTEWQDVAVFDENGATISYYSIGSDITERKLAEEETLRSLELMNAMFDGHAAPMFLIEPETGNIYLCNQAAADFFRYSKDDLVKMRIFDICALDFSTTKAMLREAFAKEQKYISLPGLLSTGETRIIDIFNSLIIYEGNKLFFSIVYDATEREKAFEEIAFLANHDSLTKVYNRAFLENEYVVRNVPENFPIGIITCDIDGLKQINQTLGTQAGDTLLILFAETLQEFAAPHYIVSRTGGDKFAILLSGLSEDELKKYTISLEERVASSMRVQALALSAIEPTASFGYGIQLNPADTLYMLMNEAEAYMLRRKYYSSSSKQSKVVNTIMNALYEKSEREQSHSKRVSHISVLIAQALGLSTQKINEIKTAGVLHDIGKIGIDERILNKPSSLNVQEWMIMRQHSIRSARILIGVDEYRDIVPMVRAHHERFDGNGYPDGLIGTEIPLEARIIAVADAYDAMTVQRPYRTTLSAEEAVEELIRCSGSQFDPDVVMAFVKDVAGRIGSIE